MTGITICRDRDSGYYSKFEWAVTQNGRPRGVPPTHPTPSPGSPPRLQGGSGWPERGPATSHYFRQGGHGPGSPGATTRARAGPLTGHHGPTGQRTRIRLSIFLDRRVHKSPRTMARPCAISRSVAGCIARRRRRGEIWPPPPAAFRRRPFPRPIPVAVRPAPPESAARRRGVR